MTTIVHSTSVLTDYPKIHSVDYWQFNYVTLEYDNVSKLVGLSQTTVHQELYRNMICVDFDDYQSVMSALWKYMNELRQTMELRSIDPKLVFYVTQLQAQIGTQIVVQRTRGLLP